MSPLYSERSVNVAVVDMKKEMLLHVRAFLWEKIMKQNCEILEP